MREAVLRVACWSPLPPSATGIADYTAELTPWLARRLDLTLVVGDRDAAPERSLEGVPIVRAAAAARHADEFELHLYHLGNNPDFHGFVWEALHRRPGVVVLHEFMLQHLIQGLTLAGGDRAGYLEEMRYAYGETAQRLAAHAVDSGFPLDIWRYPLFERVVDDSLGLIVHSEFTRRRVLASRPGARVAVVRHHLSLDALPAAGDEARRAARRELGLAPSVPVVGSFGFVTPQKRLETVVGAFRRLRAEMPEAILLVAGEVSPFYDLDDLLGGAAGAGVRVTGRLPLPQLLLAMSACDLAVNLRWPTGGETSGTLMRLLGLGKPVIVSDHGPFAELPAGCAARVAPGPLEEEHLAALMERLLTDRELAAALGRNARREVTEHHTLEGSAAGYHDFLEQIAAAPPSGFAPAPPLTTLDPADLPRRVLAELGSAAAELGVDERDRGLLEALARRAEELGLAPDPLA